MTVINSIAVFCGSSSGKHPVYEEKTIELGNVFLQHNIGLIYGSGKLGLMGAISKTVHEGGGKVTGVIPQFMKAIDEDLQSGYGEEIVVNTMHERKDKMATLADAFIALPGGFGTMEELVEITTWRQLNLLKKPIGLLNVNGFYNHFVNWISHSVEEGFISSKSRDLIIVCSNPNELVSKLKSYQSVDVNKFEKQ